MPDIPGSLAGGSPSSRDLLLLRVSCQPGPGTALGAASSTTRHARADGRDARPGGGGGGRGAAPHWRGDRDEVRVAAGRRRTAGEEQFLAGAQLRSSAALFLLHLSLQLAAPCAEDGKGVLTEQQAPGQPGSTGVTPGTEHPRESSRSTCTGALSSPAEQTTGLGKRWT